ncbi:hypothetical protein ACH5RR_038100 [Cinchona calisaya]|uniref:Reverse transcriptase domain-containing protein n=1 Tax=Cinchona calisaya TaxID=153742 RepID=A0ABD2YAE1_9GENT
MTLLFPSSPRVTIKHFRPIALCNSVYKFLSEVLVNRIRPLIRDLISPHQASFIPARKGSDDVIIVQELIHKLNSFKGKNGTCAIKLDLEKACDKVEWNFIHYILLFLDFPSKILNIIMACMTSAGIAVIHNGTTIDWIYPTRDIR